MNRSKRIRPFVLAATDQGSLIVNRLDFHKKGDQPAFGVGYSLLSEGSFDADEVDLGAKMLDWLREFRGDGVLALDCGANIGVHTVEWSRHMTDWGQVLAFEAQERLYYALAGNVCLNNCFNARVFHLALGDKSGSMQIPVPNYCAPASFGSLELTKRESSEEIGQTVSYDVGTQAVSVLKLDDLNLTRVDFIKIDVEGMECAVLDGAKKLIEASKPYIIVEYNKSGIENVTKRLANFDYTWIQVGINLLSFPKSDPAVNRIAQ